MKLSDITPKTPLVKDFVARLTRSTKQAIPIVDVEKVKRVSGASVRPVNLVLENGQTVKIYLRLADDHFDIFRIDINDKAQPLSGDFDNSYKPSFNASVDALAATIRNSQTAFTKKLAKKRIKPPAATSKPPQNKSQQLKAIIADIKALDSVIATETAKKEALASQLERLQNPDATV